MRTDTEGALYVEPTSLLLRKALAIMVYIFIMNKGGVHLGIGHKYISFIICAVTAVIRDIMGVTLTVRYLSTWHKHVDVVIYTIIIKMTIIAKSKFDY